MTNRHLEAFCGLYCGSCTIYLARERGELEAFALSRGRTLEEATCESCRTGVLSSSCRECELRDCAEGRGLSSCSECGDVPCDKVLRVAGLRPHLVEITGNLEQLRKIGPAAWLAEQADRWACPACGTTGAWYETSCTRCGASLPAGYER